VGKGESGGNGRFSRVLGQGLTTFEGVLDRDEKLMAVLGSRLLEPQKKVAESLDIATAIVKQAPDRASGWIHRAYSLRRTKNGGIEKAKKMLEDAAGLFPKEWLIPYNLACYCAQLGQLDEATKLLQTAYALGDEKQIKLMALDDEDLEPLWKGLK